MRKETGIVVGIIVLVLIVGGGLISRNNSSAMNAPNNVGGSNRQSGGSLYVGIADASADISGVNDIDLSLNKIELYNSNAGWINLSSNAKSYALLTLKANGHIKLYIEKENLPAGFYNKVRVTIGNVIVHPTNSTSVQAIVPSPQIVINMAIQVRDNQSTHIKLDFLADKSLHMTNDGHYVFAPVIAAESKSNTSVNVDSDDTVNLSGGTVDSNVNVGVDLNGSSRANFQLNTDNTLKVDSKMGNQVNFVLGGKNYTSDNSKDHEDEMNNAGTMINALPSLNISNNSNTNSNSNAGSNSSGSKTQGGNNNGSNAPKSNTSVNSPINITH